MASKALPSQEVLRQLLEYDPETGALTWKERSRDWFTSNVQYKIWNKRYAGTPALSHIDAYGYATGAILGANYKAHRVIWMMENGFDPMMIDHINGDRSDNRLANLRSVDERQNGRNQARRKDSSSGVTGVCWGAHVGKWMAYINVGGRANRRRIHIGVYPDFDDAVAARKAAEKAHGFHANHGRKD